MEEKPFKPVSCKTKGEAKTKEGHWEAEGAFGQSHTKIKGRHLIFKKNKLGAVLCISNMGLEMDRLHI